MLLITSFSIMSCTEDDSTISGKPGEVMIVINDDYWKSPLGQAIRDSLTIEYPMLIPIEQQFRLCNVSHGGFTTMMQIFRNIVKVDISASNIDKITYRKNVWATPQCVIEINAKDYNSALELFNENAADIRAHIENAERERLISNNTKYNESKAEAEVREIFGGSPKFPQGTKVFSKTDDFIWLATTNNDFVKKYIILYKYPVVEGEDMMSRESLIENNLKAINTNIPGMKEGSYMTHSKVITPTIEYINYKNNKVAEIRGWWDVENDFMGGPFISHVVCSPDGKQMVGIEGFVYAPKYDKIQHIRDLDAIVYSYEWGN
jgi:hypothetical protein